MTLLECIRKIEDVATNQPSVRSIVENDVYRLNSLPDAEYGVFAFTQGQHTGNTQEDWMRYQFTLFYVDRLTEDKSNQIEVQSVGVQTIANILRTLDKEGMDVGDYSIQPFNERFSDECAGVYTNVTIGVQNDYNCEDSFNIFYDDFNDDFNEDFSQTRHNGKLII